MSLLFLAASSDMGQVKQSYSNLIFMGAFFIVVIIIAVWWLRRG